MSKFMLDLMNDSSVNRIADECGNQYGVRVLSKGETLFFQENDKALICCIDAVYGIVYTRSVVNWDDHSRMSPAEKTRVIALIKKYYGQVYNLDVKLSDSRC